MRDPDFIGMLVSHNHVNQSNTIIKLDFYILLEGVLEYYIRDVRPCIIFICKTILCKKNKYAKIMIRWSCKSDRIQKEEYVKRRTTDLASIIL